MKREKGTHEKWFNEFEREDFDNGAFTDELAKKMRWLDELLGYVYQVELAIEAGYQMCDGNEYEKFITVWTSCNYRPRWLPEHRDAVSCSQTDQTDQ